MTFVAHQDDLQNRLRDVFARIFNIDVSRIAHDASAATIENWDSLHHLMLMMALEQEFDVVIPPDRTPSLTSYILIERYLACR